MVLTIEMLLPVLSVLLSAILGLLVFFTKKTYQDVGDKIESLSKSIEQLNLDIAKFNMAQTFKAQELSEMKIKMHDNHNLTRKVENDLTKLEERFLACQKACERCKRN